MKHGSSFIRGFQHSHDIKYMQQYVIDYKFNDNLALVSCNQ